jgi:hypothetical protein
MRPQYVLPELMSEIPTQELAGEWVVA